MEINFRLQVINQLPPGDISFNYRCLTLSDITNYQPCQNYLPSGGELSVSPFHNLQ